MTVVSIPTLDIFAPAIAYHAVSQQFSSEHGTQILVNAQALSAELHQSAPQQADAFDKAMQTLAQRFIDEAELHQQAVANMTSHFDFLATREAAFSGTVPQTLPPMPLLNIAGWLDIQHTPLNGIFDEVERQLHDFAGDLEAFEGRLNDFEHIVSLALNNPDQLAQFVQLPEPGWEPDWLKGLTQVGDRVEKEVIRHVAGFIQGFQSEIFTLIDQGRQAFSTIFLPRTDPGVLQGHIDYLTALKTAYDHHVRAPFVEATQPVATQYHPPDGQDSYQKAWPTIAEQQGHTSMALSNAIAQLGQLQALNEVVTINTGVMIVAIVACGVALALCLGVVPIPASAPAAGGSAGTAAGAAGGATAAAGTAGATIGGIEIATFLGVPAWWWGAIAMIGGTIVGGTGVGQVGVGSSATSVSTSHATSITLVGGGATSGGQTVVVNGDGTAADAGGLSISDQEAQALNAAWDCDIARADRMDEDPGSRGNFNTAIGFAWLVGGRQEVAGPEFGTGGPATHSEPKIIVDWEAQIPTLGAQSGSHLMLLLFTRNPMCPTCQSNVPAWNQRLAAVAGAGVTVHFYIWQSIDPYDDVGPLNIEPVPLP